MPSPLMMQSAMNSMAPSVHRQHGGSSGGHSEQQHHRQQMAPMGNGNVMASAPMGYHHRAAAIYPPMPPPPPMMANGLPGRPPLSGPNPFMAPSMMGPNPMISPSITVGQLAAHGLPPSPPPPQQIPLPPPNPKTFQIRDVKQQSGNHSDGRDRDRHSERNQENDAKRDNVARDGQSAAGGNAANNPFPFNCGGLNFPAPHAPPQLADSGGDGTNTPNRATVSAMNMPTFMPPLSGPPLMNPMIPPLGNLPIPPKLSPTLDGKVGGASSSNSPQLGGIPMGHSPPNMFVPPFPGKQPPPPQKFQIPSPNLAQFPVPGMPQFPRPNTSPSPPVSPLLNNMANPIPFIPSPQLMPPGNAQMPPMQLNHPLFLQNQFNKINLGAAQQNGPSPPTTNPHCDATSANPTANCSTTPGHAQNAGGNQSNATRPDARNAVTARPPNSGATAE